MDREKVEYWFAVLLNNLTRGMSVDESLRNATIDMASVFDVGPPRCDHDVIDGNWCEACNRQMKDAALKGNQCTG